MTPDGDVIDLNDMSSLAPKPIGMRIEIVCLLKRQGPLSVRSIAGRLGKPCNSVRMRLSRMREAGWVQNDSLGRPNGVTEWTWSLTDLGRDVAGETGAAE